LEIVEVSREVRRVAVATTNQQLDGVHVRVDEFGQEFL
jgi:hypothetical protein